METATSEILKNIFYNNKNPASFRNAQILYKEAKKLKPNIKLKNVKDWLSGQLTYTLHKPARRVFKRNKYFVTKPLEQFQADLVDMRMHNKDNKPYNYILTAIDCFSKYAYAIPLKNKSGNEVLSGFKIIFQNKKPQKVQTDRGKEFLNSIVQKYLAENEIHFFTTFNTKFKCAIVERFNRTLKRLMYMNFTARGQFKYVDILQDIVNSYNNSYHRTIKAKPSEVNFDNSDTIFKNIYKFDSPRDYLNSKTLKPKYIAGDLVRKKYELTSMDKSFYPNWTDEVFKIKKSIKSHERPMYVIENQNNIRFPQRIYQEEVQKIKQNKFRIDKIIKPETRDGKEGFIVKWTNYSTKDNSWIPKEDLVYLNDRTRNN